MIILGIDPGTLALGYGVIERVGSSVRRITSGVVTPAPGELASRLVTLFSVLEEVVREHRPEAVAVEDLFHARNAKSALTLGHARGVALLVAGRAGLPVFAYAPPLVKKAIVGHGRAEKFQVQKMVRALLGLGADPLEDEADALAVALCHSQRALSFVSVSDVPAAAVPVAPRRTASSAAPLPAHVIIPASELAAAMAKKRPRAKKGGVR